jgi:hypothetical protein
MQFGFSFGLGSNFMATASWYNLQPTQIPKAVSKYKSNKQMIHNMQTGSK